MAGATVCDLLVWLPVAAVACLLHGRWPRLGAIDGVAILPRLIGGHVADPAGAWPEPARRLVPSTGLYYGIVIALLIGMGAVVIAIVDGTRRWRGALGWGLPHPPGPGFASVADIRRCLNGRTVRRAQSLLTTAPEKGSSRSVAIYLGRDMATRMRLWGSAENSYLLLAPPRRGKGLGVIIPNIADWPGPMVVPSTKDDNIVHTACLVARERPVYVFDPLGLSEWRQAVRWSPVPGCENPDVAIYRAKAFTAASGATRGIEHADYFQAYNETIHRCYLHAAAVSQRDIATVRDWVNRADIAEAVHALASSDKAPEWADDLRAIGSMHHQAQTNVFSGARRALDCLADPRVLDACRPEPVGSGFDPERFLDERAVLYLVGTSGAQVSMAPIITSLIESIVDIAKRRAARHPSRRLTPPLGLFLDECANIAPLPSLPQLVSDGGGQGITTMVVLQSLGQARARWGVYGTTALWDACTAKIVLGGLADDRDLEMISKLCGEVDSPVAGWNEGHDGQRTRTMSRRRQPVMGPARTRNLRKWRGLLLYEELLPIRTSLPGWWMLRRYRDRIAEAIREYRSRAAFS